MRLKYAGFCLVSRFQGLAFGVTVRDEPEVAKSTVDPSPNSSDSDIDTNTCSEEGSHLRLIDFVDHSTLGLRGIKKKRRTPAAAQFGV